MSQPPNQPDSNEPGNLQPGEKVSATITETEKKVIEPPAVKSARKNNFLRWMRIKLKRNWLEYILEFLLVVAAVSMGFLADSIREKKEDRQKEKKYIRSLLRDLDADFSLAKSLSDTILRQALEMDSLQQFLASGMENDPGVVVKCYDLSPACIRTFPEFFYERTITQLLSSGSMRLIRDQAIADSIMVYYSGIKFLDMVRQNYLNSIDACSKNLYDIFDISFIRTTFDEKGNRVMADTTMNNLKFRTNNPAQLDKFNALVEMAKARAHDYASSLVDMTEKALNLFVFLRSAYHIKEGQE